jgi:hypothetical protein
MVPLILKYQEKAVPSGNKRNPKWGFGWDRFPFLSTICGHEIKKCYFKEIEKEKISEMEILF